MLFLEKAEELFVGESCLAHDAFDDVLGQVKAFVVGDGDTSSPLGVFQVHMRPAGLMDIKPCPLESANDLLRAEVGKLRHASDGDFEFFDDGLLARVWVFGDFLAILNECP